MLSCSITALKYKVCLLTWNKCHTWNWWLMSAIWESCRDINQILNLLFGSVIVITVLFLLHFSFNFSMVLRAFTEDGSTSNIYIFQTIWYLLTHITVCCIFYNWTNFIRLGVLLYICCLGDCHAWIELHRIQRLFILFNGTQCVTRHNIVMSLECLSV